MEKNLYLSSSKRKIVIYVFFLYAWGEQFYKILRVTREKNIYIYNLNCIQNNIDKTLTRIENMCYQRER